jgi:hypothetical protein
MDAKYLPALQDAPLQMGYTEIQCTFAPITFSKIRCMLEKRTNDLQFVDIADFARLMGRPSK